MTENRMAVVDSYSDFFDSVSSFLEDAVFSDETSFSASLAAAANDFTDQLVIQIARATGNTASYVTAGRVLSQSNAAIAAVLELPEVLQAIENGEDVTTQIVGALGSVLGGYAGTTIGVAAAGAIAGFIGGIIALPAVAVVGGTVAAGVIGGFLVGSVTETLFENAAGGNLFGSLIDDLQDGLSNVFNLQEAQVDWRATENNLRERFSDQPEVLAAILVELATVRTFPGAGREDFINAFENDIVLLSQQCFPAQTPITLANQTTKPISEITIGDRILSYDKDGNLVEGVVDKLFRNTTQEWINLSFNDGRDDLVATPGHRFLTETGDFMEIGHMVRLGGGNVRLVEKDGSIVEARGELISYSAETAHMFEEAQSRATIFDGNLAVKHDAEAGWATYNFEVRETHTYIANDIRVHNDSILSFLEEGDTIYALTDDLRDMAVARDTDGDGVNEIVLLDGERFVDVNGGDTFLEVEQTFIPDDPNADVEALLAQFIENNPEAASNVYDPGNGNVPMDGIPSDDIVEILTDDIGGTFSSRRFGGVEVPTLDALVLAAATGGAGALIGTLFAPLEGMTTDLNYVSGDGDVSITPTGPDATAILLFILGLDASAEIVPGIPDPFGGTIGGITLGDLIGGLDLPELGSFDVNFGAGITSDDVTREQVGDDLVLTIDNGDGTTSTMTLAGVYADGNADEINSIAFADGTSVPLSDLDETGVDPDGIVNGTEFADIIDLLTGDPSDGDMVTEGNDIINGLGGDDLIFGAGGDDTINGGAGDDIIEGGEGTDTLVVEGAWTDFTFAPDTFGADFTIKDSNGASVIDDGTDALTSIERIEFSDGNVGIVSADTSRTEITINDMDGARIARALIDTGSEQSWSSIITNFDENGVITSQTEYYDDGRIYQDNYENGILSTQVFNDPDDAVSWDSITRSFDANGVITDQVQTLDDGRVYDNDYENGVLTSQTFTDPEDAVTWETLSRTYEEGELTSQTTDYDNGLFYVNSYENGTITNRNITDADNNFAWTTRETTYDAAGERMTLTTTFDDGTITVFNFDDTMMS